MLRQKRWLSQVSWGGALSALLLGVVGCLTLVNPVEPLPKDEVKEIHDIPIACRHKVYIFFFQGMDPGDISNMSGVRDYLNSLGFIKTYLGYFTHHRSYFVEEIIRLHEEDPDARFVVVGFSYGANAAREVANTVLKHNITVDLLFYLGGNTLDDSVKTRPPNVLRIVNILATGWIWNGANIEGAENVQLTDVWHFGSPAHPRSTDLLARELTAIAMRVPIVRQVTPPPIDHGPVPRPRVPAVPAKGQQDTLPPPRTQQGTLPPPRTQQGGRKKGPTQQGTPRDDWDFLKPDGVESSQGGGPGHLAPLVEPSTLKKE